MTEAETNSLGLAFEQVKLSDEAVSPAPSSSTTAEAEASTPATKKDKKTVYVRDAVAPREKISEQELSDRMARIREQNEKIKQRRLDVQADEAAFKQTQDAEKASQARNRKIQDGVDKTRQQNAERKMAKIQNREWDSGKPKPSPADTQTLDRGSWSRGGRGAGSRGRGGGGGRGGSSKGGRSSSKNEGQDGKSTKNIPASDPTSSPSPPKPSEAEISPAAKEP
ncbi:hypothetical protein DL96DRAFT_1550494 [Flagelloscypha sp. PMI_526]|nr:hypothetical protein DL96DRAFT_1550494 [Flagelloscypha sp. PMI_526]